MSADPKNEYTITNIRNPQAIGANANITGIDIRDYTGTIVLCFSTGVGTGTSPTYDAYVQAGAFSNGDSSANINGTNAITQAANANTFQTLTVDTRASGSARYLKIVQTVGGSSTPLMPVGIQLIGKKQVE